MAIPVSPNARISWTDPSSGATYHFRYLLGEYQEQYNSMKSPILEAIRGFLPQAKREISAENKSKKMTDEKRNELIAVKATSLAQKKIESIQGETLRYTRQLVDIFLCGWEGKGMPNFPDDGHPSAYLLPSTLGAISSEINRLTSELCGLTVDESKN